MTLRVMANFDPRGMVDRRSMLHLIREPVGINSNYAMPIYCEIRT